MRKGDIISFTIGVFFMLSFAILSWKGVDQKPQTREYKDACQTTIDVYGEEAAKKRRVCKGREELFK